jgi:hypothetical protein
MNCPYCGRPLRRGGIKCLACRRYVLRGGYFFVFVLLAAAAVICLLEVLFRFL